MPVAPKISEDVVKIVVAEDALEVRDRVPSIITDLLQMISENLHVLFVNHLQVFGPGICCSVVFHAFRQFLGPVRSDFERLSVVSFVIEPDIGQLDLKRATQKKTFLQCFHV